MKRSEKVMGIFDSLKNIAESTIKREASKTIANAVNSIGKGKNRSECFSFTAVPQNLSELQALQLKLYYNHYSFFVLTSFSYK